MTNSDIILQQLQSGYRIVFCDTHPGDEEIFLTRPRTGLRILVRNKSQQVAFAPDETIPTPIANAVRLFLQSGYKTVSSYSVKKWTIEHAIRRGGRRVYVHCETGYGRSDNPLQLESGGIVYDFPQTVPAYVKSAVKKAFAMTLTEALAFGGGGDN